MPRINSAKYKNEIVDAFEVDDDYDNFSKELFQCPECFVKVQYNRGINHLDPHFKNWPNIEHLPECDIERNFKKQRSSQNNNVELLISTILPRAERLLKIASPEKLRKARNIYFGKRSKQFLCAINSIEVSELMNLTLRTEDKSTVKLSDIILRQDLIIDKLENGYESFICVLKGYTMKSVDVGSNIKISMTHGGKYNNSKEFELFIPSSYVSKNFDKVKSIENQLILCYGIPEKNKYGYKMDLYSIAHQIVIINPKKSK